jgi:hypothetical protein
MFVSCKNDSSEPQEKRDKTGASDTTDYQALIEREEEQEKKKVLLTSDDYIEDFIERRKKLVERLQTATPQFANYLYLDFRKANEDMAEMLYNLETDFLENYEAIYDENGDLNYNSSLKPKIKKFNSNGLEMWYIGEGMTDIRVQPKVYPQVFKGKVTPDFEDYILLNEKDDSQLMTNDAALTISFEELGNVMIRWEKFLQKYPNSNIKKEAKQVYETYQWWYLFGLDNTSTMEYSTGELYDENRLEFERFLKENPNSLSVPLVKMVLKNKESAEVFREEVISVQNEILRKI